MHNFLFILWVKSILTNLFGGKNVQNKAIRAAFGFLLVLTVLCSGALAGDSVVSIAKRTMNSPGDVLSHKAADAYNGTFVLFNCGNYTPAYWIREGKAYAVNGVALTSSPGIDKAPPSIKWSLLEDALKGKAPATVPAFGVTPENLMKYINNGMKDRKAPTFKKETYYSYTLEDNNHLVGMVTMREVGGEVSQVHLEINQRPEQLRKKTFLSIVPLFVTSEDHEKIKQTIDTLSSAWTNPGKEVSAMLDGKKFTFLLKGEYRNITIEPVTQ